jgi:hypothetical protein
MKFTIICDDGFVSVDGVGYDGFDLSGLDPTIRAVQWGGVSGEVEYRGDDGRSSRNEQITDYSLFSDVLASWAAHHTAVTTPVEPPAPTLQELQSESVRAVDADADAIYVAVLGNRGPEYERAERDALDFQSAGFSGPVPPYVATWASASGMTDQAAAEDILAQAAAWNAAAIAIRQNRLSSKAAIRAAQDEQGVAAALSAWTGFVQVIKTQLGA